MALTTNRVTVTGTPVALHSAGPTQLRIFNIGTVTVWVGTSGAGNQRYPVESSEESILTIGAADVVFASVDGLTNGQVAILHN